MKKILSILLSLSVCSFVAQQSLNYPLEISYDCIEDQNLKTPTVINQPKTGDTIWSEDFGNGFPRPERNHREIRKRLLLPFPWKRIS